MITQKIFDQLLLFVITYQHAKNQFIPSVHSSDKVNFRVQSPDWPHPFFTMLTSKIFNHLLICVKLYQHAKNQLVRLVLSWDTILDSRDQISHTHFDQPHQKLFNPLLTLVNLYQHAKNEAVSSICSGEMLDLKILQSEWLRAFWPISQEQHFPQMEDL